MLNLQHIYVGLTNTWNTCLIDSCSPTNCALPGHPSYSPPLRILLPNLGSSRCRCVNRRVAPVSPRAYTSQWPKVCACRPFQSYSIVSTLYAPLHGMINTSLLTIGKLTTFLGIAILLNDALLYLPGGVWRGDPLDREAGEGRGKKRKENRIIQEQVFDFCSHTFFLFLLLEVKKYEVFETPSQSFNSNYYRNMCMGR